MLPFDAPLVGAVRFDAGVEGNSQAAACRLHDLIQEIHSEIFDPGSDPQTGRGQAAIGFGVGGDQRSPHAPYPQGGRSLRYLPEEACLHIADNVSYGVYEGHKGVVSQGNPFRLKSRQLAKGGQSRQNFFPWRNSWLHLLAAEPGDSQMEKDGVQLPENHFQGCDGQGRSGIFGPDNQGVDVLGSEINKL
jgi:hypothetical protein